MHIYDNPHVHMPIGLHGPDNKLALQQKKKKISNDTVNDWKRKKSVCQAYDQTDNSTVQLDLHHSL